MRKRARKKKSEREREREKEKEKESERDVMPRGLHGLSCLSQSHGIND